jgi:hypothetical protein
MYFVRFPKPPEVMPAEVHALETEVEVYRQTVRAMTSTLDSLRVSGASQGPQPCKLSIFPVAGLFAAASVVCHS